MRCCLQTISEGLLPKDERLDRAFRYVTLEAGLVVAIILILAGLGGSAYAYWSWDRLSFGNLDPVRTMRLVIPAVTALRWDARHFFPASSSAYWD